MPNEYEHARAQRHDAQNKSRIVIESPGVHDETEKKGPKVEMGKGMRQVEPGDPGTGKYSDRIKIEPKYNMPEKKPLPSDSEIQKIRSSEVTTT